MDIKLYDFPVLEKNNLKDIEVKFCVLLNKYREGRISPEEKDWMDWANNVFLTSS